MARYSQSRAATRYLEASVNAGATGLPAEHREALESQMADLERKVPGTRRRAIAGTRRHFDRPLSPGERSHQAHLREREGLSMGDVDRIGSELDTPPPRSSGSSERRRAVSGARRVAGGGVRAVRAATPGGGNTFIYIAGIGLVLILLYIFIAKRGGTATFTGILGLITGSLTAFIRPIDPITAAEGKLGAAPLASPAPITGSTAAGSTPTGLLAGLFPKGTTYAVSRTDAGKDFSNIGGFIGALEPGTISAVHSYSGFGTTIFQKLDTPIAGKQYAYYALETGGTSKVKPGQRVGAGTPLATGKGGVIEVGLSSSPDVTGIEQGGAQEHGGTPTGLAFAKALGL